VSKTLQLLRTLVPAFQVQDGGRSDTRVALVRLPARRPIDDKVDQEFYRLMDRTRQADERTPREGVYTDAKGQEKPWKAPSPLIRTLFESATWQESLFWETPGSPAFYLAFEELAMKAWGLLPTRLKDYKPIHNLGDIWNECQQDRPEPSWRWLNFVFHQLCELGIFQRRSFRHAEFAYLTVSPFQASIYVIELLAGQASIRVGTQSQEVKPCWDRVKRTLTIGNDALTYGREAPAHFWMLDAFEAKDWPNKMPTPRGTCRTFGVKDTIGTLNKKVLTTRLRFTRTENDTTVGWYLTSC
jgi:hypothetical protein